MDPLIKSQLLLQSSSRCSNQKLLTKATGSACDFRAFCSQKGLDSRRQQSVSVAVLDEAVLPRSGILPRRLSRHCGASVVTARDAVANRTEIPMKLTDTQLVLLSAASQRDDCAIEIAPNLKGGAAHNVVGKLLSEGLVEEIHAGGSLTYR